MQIVLWFTKPWSNCIDSIWVFFFFFSIRCILKGAIRRTFACSWLWLDWGCDPTICDRTGQNQTCILVAPFSLVRTGSALRQSTIVTALVSFLHCTQQWSCSLLSQSNSNRASVHPHEAQCVSNALWEAFIAVSNHFDTSTAVGTKSFLDALKILLNPNYCHWIFATEFVSVFFKGFGCIRGKKKGICFVVFSLMFNKTKKINLNYCSSWILDVLQEMFVLLRQQLCEWTACD